jgi:hypothetical protein
LISGVILAFMAERRLSASTLRGVGDVVQTLNYFRKSFTVAEGLALGS